MKSKEIENDALYYERDCGDDPASDKGYWLEKCDKERVQILLQWREKAGMERELLCEMAKMSLSDFLLIESGKRKMTQGEAWRIDAAIIDYRKLKKPGLLTAFKRWLTA
ncbi:MAG: hypothetical protein WBJ10_03460 [Daejeonella sp.]|uniref:hypothetical protein n=1 Tax=Daejeonella sp. TaxID=2805397 RepID=UPI003C745FE2